MPRKTVKEMADQALKAAPAEFLTELRKQIGACRSMVWTIIQNKQFDGFHEVDQMVTAYDHLDKAMQIFSKVQLPLPAMGKEGADKEEAQNPALPMV